MRNDHPSPFWNKERRKSYVVTQEQAADRRISQLYHLQEVHWRCPAACPCPFHRTLLPIAKQDTDTLQRLPATPIDELPTRPPAPKTGEFPAVRDTDAPRQVTPHAKKTLHIQQVEIIMPSGQTGSIRQLSPTRPIEEIETVPLPPPPTKYTEPEIRVTRSDTQSIHTVSSAGLSLRQAIIRAVGQHRQAQGGLPCLIEMSADYHQYVLPHLPDDWQDGYHVGDLAHTIIHYAVGNDLKDDAIRCISAPLEKSRSDH